MKCALLLLAVTSTAILAQPPVITTMPDTSNVRLSNRTINGNFTQLLTYGIFKQASGTYNTGTACPGGAAAGSFCAPIFYGDGSHLTGLAGGGDMAAANYITSQSGAPTNPCTTAGSFSRDTSTTPYSLYFCPSASGNWIGPIVAETPGTNLLLGGTCQTAASVSTPPSSEYYLFLDSGNSCHLTSMDHSRAVIDLQAAVVHPVASGTASLGTSSIASGACATAVTVSASGVATTDVIAAGFNADPTAVTGYTPAGMLTVIPYPTTNNVNFRVCNQTASSVTPGAITLNWRVAR